MHGRDVSDVLLSIYMLSKLVWQWLMILQTALTAAQQNIRVHVLLIMHHDLLLFRDSAPSDVIPSHADTLWLKGRCVERQPASVLFSIWTTIPLPLRRRMLAGDCALSDLLLKS